jgi:hypothetical protein
VIAMTALSAPATGATQLPGPAWLQVDDSLWIANAVHPEGTIHVGRIEQSGNGFVVYDAHNTVITEASDLDSAKSAIGTPVARAGWLARFVAGGAAAAALCLAVQLLFQPTF